MIDVYSLITKAMEFFPMDEKETASYQEILHDLKTFVLDFKSVKDKVEALTSEERLFIIEDRLDFLLRENAKLRLILEERLQVSNNVTNIKTRRKS